MSVTKLERNHFFSCPYGRSKEDYAKFPAAPQSTERWIGLLKTMKVIAEGADFRRRSRSYVCQRVERKAPGEPRSFTEDYAFHQLHQSPATGAAAELAEVLLAGWTLV